MVSTALFLYLPGGVCGVCAWVWLDDWETRRETGPGDSWMVNARNARREKYRQSESKKKVYNNRLRQDELGPGTYVEGKRRNTQHYGYWSSFSVFEEFDN